MTFGAASQRLVDDLRLLESHRGVRLTFDGCHGAWNHQFVNQRTSHHLLNKLIQKLQI